MFHFDFADGGKQPCQLFVSLCGDRFFDGTKPSHLDDEMSHYPIDAYYLVYPKMDDFTRHIVVQNNDELAQKHPLFIYILYKGKTCKQKKHHNIFAMHPFIGLFGADERVKKGGGNEIVIINGV